MTPEMRSAWKVLEAFRSIDPEINVTQVMIYLAVMQDGNNVSYAKDIQGKLALTSATTSRSIAALCEFSRLHKPGLGLLSQQEAPEDRRLKVVKLTAKSRLFAARLTA